MNGLLWLHLFGAILFVGNIITAAFWKVMSDRQHNPSIIHSAAKHLMLADYVFTLPGLALLLISGVLMAVKGGYTLSGMNWLTLSLLLMAVTGAIWLGFLLPLQRKMIRLSAEGMRSGILPKAYHKASSQWAIYGTAATLLPVAILYLMVFKSF
ncbi:DUF2269 family protein [Paenibacillus senegalensis]|uniref:DUF2269 family protein n=1 Tax=Paenibacillus senegalensis TaxID=1465766 RepID=UPI000289B44E|nr:DUF2269 family protein [Paenibacillus senegalensis]